MASRQLQLTGQILHQVEYSFLGLDTEDARETLRNTLCWRELIFCIFEGMLADLNQTGPGQNWAEFTKFKDLQEIYSVHTGINLVKLELTDFAGSAAFKKDLWTWFHNSLFFSNFQIPFPRGFWPRHCGPATDKRPVSWLETKTSLVHFLQGVHSNCRTTWKLNLQDAHIFSRLGWYYAAPPMNHRNSKVSFWYIVRCCTWAMAFWEVQRK